MGIHTPQVSVCPVSQDDTKRLCRAGPRIAPKGANWEHPTKASERARRGALTLHSFLFTLHSLLLTLHSLLLTLHSLLLTLHSPSFTLPHPASPCLTLLARGDGEDGMVCGAGESDLAAEFNFFGAESDVSAPD